MLHPFTFINKKDNQPPKASFDLNTLELTKDNYTIFADERLIDYIIHSIEQQRYIMKMNYIEQKYVMISRESYEQLIVYCFNRYSESFPKKIMDLEIVVNSKYESKTPIVLSDARTEFMQSELIYDILRLYRQHL